MPSSLNLRQKLNTGHYGPAPTVNVIPELDGNRVKIKELNLAVRLAVRSAVRIAVRIALWLANNFFVRLALRLLLD